MRKALSTVGLLVLSFISAPSFSHGNEKYSECELSRIVSGSYGGKAENAIFYCWNPNDPDAGIGIPDTGTMEMPSMEPTVVRTIFPGNDKFDRGLYEFKATKSSGSEIYGGLVISEMGLQPGDTILENDAIKILDRAGRQFPAYRDVIGMYTITRGIALIYYKNSVLMEQASRFKRKENILILKLTGKPRKATENPKMGGDICYREERMDYDFDGNLIIGCN